MGLSSQSFFNSNPKFAVNSTSQPSETLKHGPYFHSQDKKNGYHPASGKTLGPLGKWLPTLCTGVC